MQIQRGAVKAKLAAGGPLGERVAQDNSTQKEAQQPVQPRTRWSHGRAPLPTEHGGGGHGHRTLVPAAVSPPPSAPACSPTLPSPSSHLPEQKGLAQLLGAVLYHNFKSTFITEEFKAQKKIDKTQKKSEISDPATRNDPIHSGTRQPRADRGKQGLAALQHTVRSVQAQGRGTLALCPSAQGSRARHPRQDRTGAQAQGMRTLTLRPPPGAGDKAPGKVLPRPQEGGGTHVTRG